MAEDIQKDSNQSLDEQLHSKIVRNQPADSEINVAQVFVHEFNLKARIPIEQQKTSYLLHQILGNESKSLLVSPIGGLAKYEYYKPIAELQRDKSGSGSFMGTRINPHKYKHTDEDSLRFWLTNAPEFIEELIKNGWMYFPAVSPLDEKDAKELGLMSNYGMYKRKFKLSDLIKVIESSPNPQEFLITLNDFKELAKYGEEIDFVYEAQRGAGRTFFTLPVKNNKDLTWKLKLDEIDRTELGSIIDYSSRHNDLTTLKRTISFGVGYNSPENAFGFYGTKPDWWTNNNASRVGDLTIIYAKKNALDGRLEYSIKDPNYAQVSLSNRRGYTQELNPDTELLLQQAEGLRAIIKSAVKNEHEDHSKKQDKLLELQRIRLGL
jgi:hypothetical protein